MNKFKVGDNVIVFGAYHQETISEVVKITPKGSIRIKDSAYLYKSNGYQKGGNTQNKTFITIATKEDCKRIKLKKIKTYICQYNFNSLSNETLLEIYNIIKTEKELDIENT